MSSSSSSTVKVSPMGALSEVLLDEIVGPAAASIYGYGSSSAATNAGPTSSSFPYNISSDNNNNNMTTSALYLNSTNNVNNSIIYCTPDDFINATSFEHLNCTIPEGMFEMDPISVWIRLAVLILYGIICIVGLLGNTLVIYVVIRFSKMHTVTNLYIVNLAIADECFLVGIPFLMTTTALDYWPFGKFMCKMYFTTTGVNQVTSSMFLLIMSADRFIAVCHPISATKWRTPMISTCVTVTAWTLSAIIMVPIFIFATTRMLGDKISCNIYWDDWIHDTTFMMYSFLVAFAIPFILISIFYVLVIFRLRHVGPKRCSIPSASIQPPPTLMICTCSSNPETCTAHNNNNQLQLQQQQQQQAKSNSRTKDRKRSRRKVTKLVLTVITVYFLCWAPYWGLQLALAYFMEKQSTHSPLVLTIFLVSSCLSYSNSAMNPILYAFLSDNFKKSFMKACSCANKRDVNAMLHGETSAGLPRTKSAERIRRRRKNKKKVLNQQKLLKVGNKSGSGGGGIHTGNGLSPNGANGGPPNCLLLTHSPSESILLKPNHIEETTEFLQSPMVEDEPNLFLAETDESDEGGDGVGVVVGCIADKIVGDLINIADDDENEEEEEEDEETTEIIRPVGNNIISNSNIGKNLKTIDRGNVLATEEFTMKPICPETSISNAFGQNQRYPNTPTVYGVSNCTFVKDGVHVTEL